MALRLGNWVRSGAIDNTERGRITGTIHLEGLEHPLTLDLQGNAHPDLAGCRLEFRNPEAESVDPGDLEGLRPEQRGHAGVMSASRKRQVPAHDPRESGAGEIEYVLTNLLHLEWFDHHNGRIVVEGAGFEWSIDLPRWKITDEEIAAQEEQARAAANLFMNLALEEYEEINDEIRASEKQIDPKADDEFSWEQRLRHSESRVDAILNLLNEAETDEERSELLDRAFASRTPGEASEPAADFGEPDDDSWEEIRRIELDDQLRALISSLAEENDPLMHDPVEIEEDPETSGELLTMMVKVRTIGDLLLEDEVPSEPGFIIALLKREIDRSQNIAGRLPAGDGAPGIPADLSARVWRIRDLLIQIAGKLRSQA